MTEREETKTRYFPPKKSYVKIIMYLDRHHHNLHHNKGHLGYICIRTPDNLFYNRYWSNDLQKKIVLCTVHVPQSANFGFKKKSYILMKLALQNKQIGIPN